MSNESIKLLVAASKSIPEFIIRQKMASFAEFSAESTSFINNGDAIRKSIMEIWPLANQLPAPSSIPSVRKIIDGCSHLIFLWDGEDLSHLLFEARIKRKITKLIPIQVAKVVNKQETDDYDAYIGRGTPWGNPFAISHDAAADRNEVIEKYKEFFNEKIMSDGSFKTGILAMRGLRLACFCKPAPCHGDVIANYLNSLPSSDE